MTETTRRIIELQKEYGANDHQLETNAGLPVSSIQAWTKGKKRKSGEVVETSPAVDSIVKLARYFNVSADYLLGLTDERRPLSSASEAAQPSKAVAKRATTEITERFVGEFGELISDPTFCDLAKLYKAVNEVRLRAQILTVIVAYLNRNGINTESIVGY